VVLQWVLPELGMDAKKGTQTTATHSHTLSPTPPHTLAHTHACTDPPTQVVLQLVFPKSLMDAKEGSMGPAGSPMPACVRACVHVELPVCMRACMRACM